MIKVYKKINSFLKQNLIIQIKNKIKNSLLINHKNNLLNLLKENSILDFSFIKKYSKETKNKIKESYQLTKRGFLINNFFSKFEKFTNKESSLYYAKQILNDEELDIFYNTHLYNKAASIIKNQLKCYHILFIKNFLTPDGLIKSRNETGLSKNQHKFVSKLIKQARTYRLFDLKKNYFKIND